VSYRVQSSQLAHRNSSLNIKRDEAVVWGFIRSLTDTKIRY
jgi:hypothetical protein